MIGQLLALLLFGVVASAQIPGLTIELLPQTLHERTCVGLWMPAVHLHGYCIMDLRERANCTEVDRLFETENNRFDPVNLNDVPHLVMHRALHEHALVLTPRNLCVNKDRDFAEPKTGCSPGYFGYNDKCYGATKDHKVSYHEAQRQCGNVHGRLVDEYNDDIVGLVKYLTHHYIQADVFTGFHQIDDLENYQNNAVGFGMPEAHVEVDYETGRLQYVVPHEKRGYICVVDRNVEAPPLFIPVDLPVAVDSVIVHDLNPAPPVKPSVERYLVDVLRYHCPANGSALDVMKLRDLTIHRADLVDLEQNLPYGCTYDKSLGNVIYDLNDAKHIPRELNGVCNNLVELYRIYDRDQRVETFGIHKKPKSFSENRYTMAQIGHCSARKGDCGASVPLLNPGTQTPVCYLFKSHRSIKNEINERRPLRLTSLAPEFVPIYSTLNTDAHDVDIQLDPKPRSGHTTPKLLGKVLSPDSYKRTGYYCKKHLLPLYHIYDLHHKNGFVTTDINDVKKYRENRDHYSEEELLGYVAIKQGYCGAVLPLHHYQLHNDPKTRHQDDAYYSTEQRFSEDVPHDIAAYLF